MTVSPKLILYGSSRDTNKSFFTTSSANGDRPSPVFWLTAKASALNVVMVSGTTDFVTATPDELERKLMHMEFQSPDYRIMTAYNIMYMYTLVI